MIFLKDSLRKYYHIDNSNATAIFGTHDYHFNQKGYDLWAQYMCDYLTHTE